MDTEYILQVKNFFTFFLSILYEALPWVVLGTVLAGIVQEIPTRRAPAVMLSLSAVIIALFASPFSMLLTLGPAIALGGCVLGLLLLFQPAVDHSMGFLDKRRYLSIALSGLLGLVIPMCECGIIPLTRRLLRKGLPISCCVTFILSGPILNVVVLMTTYVAFADREKSLALTGVTSHQMTGIQMLGFRALLGYVVAVVVGLVAERMQRKHGAAKLLTSLVVGKQKTEVDEVVDEAESESVPLRKRLSNITDTALHDFIDITVFLVIGALIAAAAKVMISPDQIAEISKDKPTLAIGIMMAFAVVVTLCSEADAFVAANFVTLGPAAKLAFLVLGPMLDFKLIFMYTRIFRPRLMWTIIACVVLQVFVYSYITHQWWESRRPAPPSTATVQTAQP